MKKTNKKSLDSELKDCQPKNDGKGEIRTLKMSLEDIENKFIEAQSIAHFGFWELDPETWDPTWTEGVFKVLGYDIEQGQVKYYDQKKVVHPEDWNLFHDTVIYVFKTGNDAEIDLRIIRPDGKKRVIHIIGKPLKDNNNKIISVRGTVQDVTEIKEMEARLRESESFYRTLFENTGTASIIVDEDSTILMVNTQFETLSGYSKESVEGKKSWKGMVLKEDLETLEKYHSMRRNAIGTPPSSYEARFIDIEGNIKIIRIDVAMIPGTKRTIASVNDLTDLKLAEKRLQTTLKRFYTILSNLGASILLVTEERLIEFANPAFCDYFDLNESPEELTGFTTAKLIEKIKPVYKYPDEAINRINEIIERWEPVTGEEIHLNREKTCLRDFIPIFVGNKPYGRLWVHVDITERKKMEKKLVDSERQYKYIVEKSAAGIFILDKKGIIQYLNEQMSDLLRFSKNEILEKHIKNFITEQVEFYKPENLSKTKVIRYDGFEFLNKTNNKVWTILTVTPIYNEKMNYTGLIGIVTDIGLQKGLEQGFLERETILTDIIYDLMALLNDIVLKEERPEHNQKDIFKTFEKIFENS
ncbi:PAS domain-containing protein [Methanobacterium petrolearium]|uniref:PAS domain-containing protein n=1 Tax=Methanobacterium petrolearium TaxID=710190 RepID=UPI001AE8EF11|nr:PAS domain S-box protein [Methanobacterium petrolearium]MBP1945886.1 PAS domain S-box-containing protein [Methanobacterium petrolearium]BDZ69561.1 hypothetical protein GCM10025861_00780 [Methanobacterium petrolearium]